MTFVKRHAAALAFLSCLVCAFAAPYLVPGDPDSRVFRGGMLGTLLVLAAFFPAGGALLRASRGIFVRGLIFGLLFALALSLGAELAWYGELLPGRGSLIRRLAVPLMAGPLFGLLATRLLCLRPKAAEMPHPRAGRLWIYAAALFLLWLPMLLAYFPGMLNYDFAGEYAQHTEGVYSSIHPLLHSALMNGIITLGERLRDKNLGLLLYTLGQMVLFALSLGRACSFAGKRLGAKASFLMLSLFSLHPVFSTLAVSATKDTLFSAALLTLSLDVYELLSGERGVKPVLCLRFVLCCLSVALLRSNGFVALLPLLLGFFFTARGQRKKAALLCLSGLAGIALTLLALTLALRPASFPSFQFYSLPAQQLVRARAAGTLTEEQRETLEGWYTDEAGLVVHPHLADAAKGYLDRDRLTREGGEFLSLWRAAAVPGAKPYFEAFLELNVGSWYPDDRSHATIYPDVSWNDKGYLQTQEHEIPGFELRSYLPRLRVLTERICRRNEYQKIPVLSLLFSPALPFWGLLFACVLLSARGECRLSVAALGALFLWAGYLLGPCALPRYALPLFCLAPPLLAAGFAYRLQR
ncbi:MAG: DUF6020 family protein [Clostridiales bacterium]|nr:DUF6020 family protein [Clostridiales bacterium]